MIKKILSYIMFVMIVVYGPFCFANEQMETIKVVNKTKEDFVLVIEAITAGNGGSFAHNIAPAQTIDASFFPVASDACGAAGKCVALSASYCTYTKRCLTFFYNSTNHSIDKNYCDVYKYHCSFISNPITHETVIRVG